MANENQVLVEIPDIAKDVLPEPENLNFYKKIGFENISEFEQILI